MMNLEKNVMYRAKIEDVAFGAIPRDRLVEILANGRQCGVLRCDDRPLAIRPAFFFWNRRTPYPVQYATPRSCNWSADRSSARRSQNRTRGGICWRRHCGHVFPFDSFFGFVVSCGNVRPAPAGAVNGRGNAHPQNAGAKERPRPV